MCSPLRTIASPMGRDQKRPSSDRSYPTITVPKTLDFKRAEEDEVLNSKELFSPTLKFNDEELYLVAQMLDSPFHSMDQHITFIAKVTGATTICVTKGRFGAVLFHEGKWFYNS